MNAVVPSANAQTTAPVQPGSVATPTMVRNQNLYSINYNGYDWRIDNIRESDDRMTVVILAYRNNITKFYQHLDKLKNL